MESCSDGSGGRRVGYYVERAWDERSGRSVDLTTRHTRREIYNAYVPHPVASWVPVLSEETTEMLTAASAQVDALRSKASHEMSAPAEWLLTRAESAASSSIEGLHPSARRLARAEAQLALFKDTIKETDLEILRNIHATQQALQLATTRGRLSVPDVCEIHRKLMGDDPIAGRIRESQNWIASSLLNNSPRTAVFVPPPPQEVPRLMDDLVKCGNNVAVQPLVQAAIVHAQFETIHPFADGNGRTGRALIHMLLKRRGIMPGCTVPISSALAMRREQYIDALNATHAICGPEDPQRSAAYEPWIQLLCESTIEATDYAERIIAQAQTLRAEWRRRLPSGRSKSNTEVIDLVMRVPVLNAETIQSSLGISKRATYRLIQRLDTANILQQRSAGKRNRVWEATEIMDFFALLTTQPASLPSILIDDEQPERTTNPTSVCGAKTRKGTACRHPKPSPGGHCPAGHRRR